MRTPEEKSRQIEGLKRVRASLSQFSIFGDDNYIPIDAQISMIEGKTTYEDYKNADDRVEFQCYDAKEWLEGKTDEDLFEE